VPVVPLTLRVEQTYRSTGAATATNVLHFLDIGGAFTQTNMDDLVTAWTAAISPIINANWVVDGIVRCLDLSSDPPGEIWTDTSPNNGGTAGSALPPACTACVTLSAGASRRRRGRMYLPGMTEDDWTDDGFADTGVPTAIGAAVADAIGDVATACGYVQAVYSRVDGVSRAISSIAVDSVLDTQRRRQSRLV